jgi:predicted nuclease of restriction endonuclease-like (RecB) superfamily
MVPEASARYAAELLHAVDEFGGLVPLRATARLQKTVEHRLVAQYDCLGKTTRKLMHNREGRLMPGNQNLLPDGYSDFIRGLKERIRSAQVRAGLAINRELVLLYWSIGQEIGRRQRQGKWGEGIIEQIAADLRAEFPGGKGFSPRNLKYMKDLADAWPEGPILQQVIAKLPWGHNCTLLDKVKGPDQRVWYAEQAIQNGWSRNVLVHQIESRLFDRQGRALTNFDRTLPEPQSELAQQILKDPYNFDFLTLGPDVLERDLERGLIEHLRDLILELGKGFAFVGSQYHLEVGGQDFYLDLLFYHLRLRCFVVIDLKIEDFRPEFAGKMNFYLSVSDDLLRHAGDAPSIGIVLCKGRNEVIVEYALRDTAKPMGVAQYQLTQALPETLRGELPTSEELAREFPLLSLVGLRIDLERELRLLAPELSPNDAPMGLSQLIRLLVRNQSLPADIAEDLATVGAALNAAAHGADLSPERAQQAFDEAFSLLARIRELRRSS